MKRRALAAVLIGTALHSGPAARADPADWAVREGFAISAHSTGFDLPTAIAVVPRAGEKPGDILYFVTELRGAIKAVTRAGAVHHVANVATLRPARDEPPIAEEAGLAGICLDSERGYVFVTYAFLDDYGVLRNNIIRFRLGKPFRATPLETRSLARVFAAFPAGESHQIGGCEVRGGSVFVGIGDGGSPRAAALKEQLLGKVICMTVEGDPCPGNPFNSRRSPRTPAAYVWAYGFRNPFGLTLFDGSVFVVDNGLDIDRFVRVERGRNYLWDGSDSSLAARAEAVFAPAISPVQLAHYSPQVQARAFPEAYRRSFFVAVAEQVGGFNPSDLVGVLRIPFDGARGELSGIPAPFVRYRGREDQAVTGVAFGAGGLYFVPLLPDAKGTSSIYRVSYDPAREHSYILGREQGPAEVYDLMEAKGCFSCHPLGDRGRGVAPSLDPHLVRRRLRSRLSSEEYARAVERLRRAAGEPYASYRDERSSLLEQSGDEQIISWIRYKLLEPKFDNPSALMPKLGLTANEVDRISRFLGTETLPIPRDPSLLDRVKARRKPVAAGFVAGLAFALAMLGLWKCVTLVRRPSRSR